MRIGIVGSGNIGGTAARLFVAAGHDVAVSHAGPPESLQPLVASLGPRARAATVEDAIAFGQLVLLAVPWRSRRDLPADKLRGKIAIDAMNPYRPDHTLYDLGDSTSSEEVAAALPGARLVKAFNTLPAKELASRGAPEKPIEDRIALLVAGDDQDAKNEVAHVVEDIGFAPIDTGSLREGGLLQQAGGPLYLRVITGADASAALRRAEEVRRGVAEHGAAQQP